MKKNYEKGEFLESENYIVDTASDGVEGYEKFKEKKI